MKTTEYHKVCSGEVLRMEYAKAKNEKLLDDDRHSVRVRLCVAQLYNNFFCTD